MGREESETIRAITIKCGAQKLGRWERTSSGELRRTEAREEYEKKDERPSSSSSSSTITSSSSAPRWNLRSTSRAAAVADSGSEKCNDQSQASRAENGDGLTKSRVPSEKPGTCKITVSLSKREIDEDFMLLFGEPAPREPKNKRPKKLQKTLDSLYPGLRLNNISIDSYKVSKSRENGKK